MFFSGRDVDGRTIASSRRDRVTDLSATRILDLVAASKLLAAVNACKDVGVFERLAARPRTTAELAAELQVEASPLRAALRVLLSTGLVVYDGDRWSLDGEGARLDPTSPESLVPLLDLEAWAARDHLNPAGIVASLRGARRPTRVPPSVVGVLARSMEVAARAGLPHVRRVRELATCRTLADVGGGPGVFSIGLCSMHPALRAVILDRQEMLEVATRRIERAGLSARVAVHAWELSSDPIPCRIDAALISNVLHLLDEGERRALLARVRRSMTPGALLIVHDFLLAADAPSPVRTVSTLVDWLALGSAFDLGVDELRDELEAHGLIWQRSFGTGLLGTTVAVARAQ